ncbi:NADH dehydrogenase [ubiquinone] 1 beta subcomplex subunit 1 [Lasioglossum baleicum]|uniref:NADH dehydrogenase [ubiquinone] 1 beta subcomplex subunit 1 n=1 Tax=Lasioglossum baleicum TaxID=434251 RepID=UPI003FCD13CB
MSAELLRSYIKVYIMLFAGAGVFGTVGWYIDRSESLRMTRFRDKSALFGRELKPGEPPSWP